MSRLIVGQGLAGSVLAWTLIQKGEKVYVVDNGNPNSASKVSAGMISPLCGRKLTNPWRFDESLHQALQFYSSLENLFNVKLIYPKDHVKFVQDEAQKEILQKRLEDPSFNSYFGTKPWDLLEKRIETEKERFKVAQTYLLETNKLLELLRNHFSDLGILIEGSWVHPKEIGTSECILQGNEVFQQSLPCKQVIFCEGHSVTNNPWFNSLPFRPTKGEIITIRTNEDIIRSNEIVSHAHALIPVQGSKNTFRVGATYDHTCINNTTTKEGADTLIKGIQEFLPQLQTCQIISQQAGIRPNTQHQFPIIGIHPYDYRYGLFNGLGSKGSLWIPYLANLLADHIINDQVLPKEVDIKRFYSPKKRRIKKKKFNKEMSHK